MRYLVINKGAFWGRIPAAPEILPPQPDVFFPARRFSLRRKGKGSFKILIQGFSVAAVEGFWLLLDQVEKSLASLSCCFTAAG